MLAAFSLSLAAMTAAPTSADDRPFYFRSFEHGSPIVEQYKLGGLYGGKKTPYVVALNFRDEQWDVQISSGRGLPLRLRLDKAYNKIPINRIAVATGGTGEELIVLIPFGDSHEDCFANGSDVYDQLAIESDGHITLEHFPGCELAVVDASVKKSPGNWIVGPPPRK